MLNQNFDILAALLPFIGCVSYAFDTLKNKTQPNRVSWLLWTAAPFITFTAELVKHTSFKVSLITFSAGFGPLLVILTSLVNSKAYWKLTKFDFVCGSLSVLALVLWVITGNGSLAILFGIMADALAAFPTIKKAYTHPKSESVGVYLATSVGGGIVLLTVKTWTLANYGFALNLLVVDAITSFLVLFPRSRLRSAKA